MFNFKNKLVSTPPSSSDLNCICHSELVSESHELKISAGLPRFARNDAFTLAEVLITLVIIGVIAAITVPTLIAKYQKEQTVTRLKKAYSTLSQVTNKSINENGPINTWEIGAAGDGSAVSAFLNKYITPYLSIAKKPEVCSSNMKYYVLNNGERSFDNRYSRFYLNDGTSITAKINSNTANERRIDIYIDINGDKKPNKLGRDIFFYHYYLTYNNHSYIGRLVAPYTAYGRNGAKSNNTDRCSSGNEGYSCSTLIMKDGWRIADDYPW